MSRPLLGCAWYLALAAAPGIAGCTSPRRGPDPVASTAGAPMVAAVADHDAIVAAVLDRFAADHATLPDAGLLPERGPLYVLTEIGQAPRKVTRIGALPRAARPYVGRTLAELQAEADQRNASVAFIRIYAIAIDGHRASVTAGVDIALPTSGEAMRACCCVADDTYERRAGTWTFARRGTQLCS